MCIRDRSRWHLFSLPWPSPGLRGLRFNSLDLRESGLDLTELNVRPKNVSRIFEKSKTACLGPKLASHGLGTIIERSGSKFCLALVLITSQCDFVVQCYDQRTVEKSRFLMVCSTTLDNCEHVLKLVYMQPTTSLSESIMHTTFLATYVQIDSYHWSCETSSQH